MAAPATSVTKPETKRQAYEVLRAQLENERSSFISHWTDLGDYILPRRPRFTVSDVNKGDRRNQKIIDSTGTLAARTLRSGMMGGITSPARQWSKLTTEDPQLAESTNVKRWLDIVNRNMHTIFLRSNLYNSLPIIYGDLGTFATAAMMVEEDFDDVIRTYPFAVGSYMLSNDNKLRVNVFFREFRLTVRQLIDKFGRIDGSDKNINWDAFSTYIKEYWDKGEYETWIDVCHVIQPNPEFDPNKFGSRYKKYVSVYYERGRVSGGAPYINDPTFDKFLRVSGYDYFPVLAPRWETNAEDVYGTDCPGMTALGDIKALQVMQKRKAQWVEKIVMPPMKGPTSLRSAKASILPGDITYTDEREGIKGFSPTHEIRNGIDELVEDIRDTRFTIKRAFFEDLFLMLSQSDRREITAREVEERHEEKLLALGPVLEQLNQDLLDPLINITFYNMVQQSDFEMGTGPVPPPPPELQGSRLKVEYMSVMAQAQKLVGVSSLERFAGFVANFAGQSGDLSVMRKVNSDQLIDVYADRLSIDPTVIRSDEEVAEIAAKQQQAQEAAAKTEQLKEISGAAKNLANADMGGDNALTRLTKGMKQRA